MNIKHITINSIDEYRPLGEPVLYISSERNVADCLTSKGEAVCIYVCNEEQLSAFEGYKYFITEGVQYSGHLDMVYCHIKNIPYVIAENEDFFIREECLEDLPKIYEMYEDEECKRFLEPLPELSDELTPESRFESVKNGYMLFEYGMWIIELKETGEAIGRVGFEYYDENTVSLGFMIRKDQRGKGFGKAAATLCVGYLLNTLPEMKIVASVCKDNKSSLSLLNKLSQAYTDKIKIMLL